MTTRSRDWRGLACRTCLALAALVGALQASLASADSPALPASVAPLAPTLTSFGAVERYAMGLRARFGVARAPFFTRAFPVVRGHGFVFDLAGAYRLDRQTVLALQAPLMALSVAQPAGSYIDVFSWGNPNITALRDDLLLQRGRSRLRGSAGASLALPIAEHGPRGSLLGLRALALASALDAFRQQELYSAGTVPLTLSYGVTVEHTRVALDAGLRLPVFFRYSRAGLPSDAHARAVAVAPVLQLGARVAATSWLDASLHADTVFKGREPVAVARSTKPTQFALTPALSLRLPRSLRLRSEFVLPLGGSLGGHVYAGSLQLTFER